MHVPPIDIVISLCKPRKTCHDPRKVKLVFLQAKLIIVPVFVCANFVALRRTEFRILSCRLLVAPFDGIRNTKLQFIICNLYTREYIGYRVAFAVLHWYNELIGIIIIGILLPHLLRLPFPFFD